MEIGPTQIGIDQKDPAILLAGQSMSKIVGHKSLAFARQRAGNQNTSQRLFVSNLIETRTKRSELLSHSLRRRGVDENVPF